MWGKFEGVLSIREQEIKLDECMGVWLYLNTRIRAKDSIYVTFMNNNLFLRVHGQTLQMLCLNLNDLIKSYFGKEEGHLSLFIICNM
jgi:hypothetical protein